MHRMILNPPVNRQVDHINHDRLDNRRENLRICTNAQNQRNKGKQKLIVVKPTSRFKGVHYSERNGWGVMLWFENKAESRGYYDTEIEAAYVYNQLAIEYHKDFAVLNEFTPEELETLKNTDIKNRGEKKRIKSKYMNVTFNICKKAWEWRKMIHGKIYLKQYFKSEEEAYNGLQNFLTNLSDTISMPVNINKYKGGTYETHRSRNS